MASLKGLADHLRHCIRAFSLSFIKFTHACSLFAARSSTRVVRKPSTWSTMSACSSSDRAAPTRCMVDCLVSDTHFTSLSNFAGTGFQIPRFVCGVQKLSPLAAPPHRTTGATHHLGSDQIVNLFGASHESTCLRRRIAKTADSNCFSRRDHRNVARVRSVNEHRRKRFEATARRPRPTS